MSLMRPDPPRLRLDPTSYEALRQAVLKRDGWRCQSCGTMSNLEVHHKQFLSHSGDDSEGNLITLCTECHDAIHHNVRVKGRSQVGALRKPRARPNDPDL